MTTYNDKFIKDAEHVTRLSRETADALWQAIRDRDQGPWEASVSPPPWLQGMTVHVEATSSTRYDGEVQQVITCLLRSSSCNKAFDPVRTSIRLSSPTYDEFMERVAPVVEAAIYEADQRVPAQRLADMIWQAGLNNPSSRFYAQFRRDYATKCVEVGTRPAYGAMKAEHAGTMIEWLVRWCADRDLVIPDVTWLDEWSQKPAHGDDLQPADPFWI